MPRARIVRVVYRDSILITLGRLLGNRVVLVSLILIFAGTSLFLSSLQKTSTIDSKVVQTGILNVKDSTYSDFYFGQGTGLKTEVALLFTPHVEIQYKIYGVDNYSVASGYKTDLFYVASGVLTSGNPIELAPAHNPQGQIYEMMVKSPAGIETKVEITVTQDVILNEHGDINTGGQGVMVGMTGLALLAARVPVVYHTMKGL